MRRFGLTFSFLIFVAVPALCVAQSLPGNQSCQDLLALADGQASHKSPAAKGGAKIDDPNPGSRLVVGESGAPLWTRQDEESPTIATLEKGEQLTAVGYGLGAAPWYMVRSQKGIVGWVRSSDIQGGDQLKKSPAAALNISNPVGPVDAFSQTLLSYDTALCRRLVSGQISVDEFNSLHSAMVLRLNAERARIANEHQRLQAQREAVDVQREAIQAQRDIAQAQRDTAEALMDQRERQYEAERQKPKKPERIHCDGRIVSGQRVRLNCK
jgi:hypothetical protein